MRLTLEVELTGPGALVRGLGGVPPGSGPPVPQQAPALTLPSSGELQGRAPSRVRGTAGGHWLPSSGAASKPVTLGIFSLFACISNYDGPKLEAGRIHKLSFRSFCPSSYLHSPHTSSRLSSPPGVQGAVADTRSCMVWLFQPPAQSQHLPRALPPLLGCGPQPEPH